MRRSGSASTEVLRHPAAAGCCVVAATHDLEVPGFLQSEYRSFHFSEDVGDTGLKFSYALQPGVAQQRNAIRLLHHLGYPDDIVRRATALAEELVDAPIIRCATGKGVQCDGN